MFRVPRLLRPSQRIKKKTNKNLPTVQPLVFSDPTNKQGVYEDILFLTCANTTSFPKNDAVRLVNLGLDSVCDLIQTVDTNWAFEDLGQSDLPIGLMDFTAGQQDYGIDNDFLSIRGVWENTTPGTGTDTWKELTRLDKSVLNSDSAVPNLMLNSQRGYWIDGNSIYFKPTPSSTTTGNNSTFIGYGFKVLFQRAINYIATDATSANLGYSPLFYRLAALYAARDYCMVNSLDQVDRVLQQIAIQEQRLKQNYARRNKTQNKRMSVAQVNDK